MRARGSWDFHTTERHSRTRDRNPTALSSIPVES
jgi:hypothetical protein